MSEAERSTIPMSLKSPGKVIRYENRDDDPVRMGDMVSVTVFGPDAEEMDATGELMEVSYGPDGFISSVRLYNHRTDYLSCPISCEGVIYRPTLAHGTTGRSPAERLRKIAWDIDLDAGLSMQMAHLQRDLRDIADELDGGSE